jgi:hypothetical protein
MRIHSHLQVEGSPMQKNSSLEISFFSQLFFLVSTSLQNLVVCSEYSEKEEKSWVLPG